MVKTDLTGFEFFPTSHVNIFIKNSPNLPKNELFYHKIGYVVKENHLNFAQIGLVALFSIRCKQTTMIGSFIQPSNGFILFK